MMSSCKCESAGDRIPNGTTRRLPPGRILYRLAVIFVLIK
jgi:hypothetical protein